MNTNNSTRFKNLVRALLRYATSKEWIRSNLLQLSRAGLLPECLWRRLPVDYTFTVTLSDGVSFMYCSVPYDTIGRAPYWKGLTFWEADTIPVFYQLAKRARIVLDIGANTGFYSLLTCAANPVAEVFSFEPVPKVFSRLEINIAANGFQNRCHANEIAVSNSVGQVEFCELEGDVPTASSLEVNGYRGNKGKVIKVSVTTIDAFDLPAEFVDLVKIDVETFEEAVLEGMTSLLEKHPPNMIVECNYDGPFHAVENILRRYGYTFFHLTAGGPKMMEHICPDPKGKFLNFLCLPPGNSINVFEKKERFSMRTSEQLRSHYQIERELADKLRKAPAIERPKLYSQLYDELFRRVPELVNHDQDTVIERIKREIRPLRGWLNQDTVFLEIGPGNCRMSVEVARLVKKVIAIDVSSEITKHSETPDNFSLVLSNGSSIPVPENSIDVAYSNQLMEHLHPDDAMQQLNNIYRALAPGGIYLCLTPNRLSGPHDISKYFDEVATGFHLHEYTNIELVDVFYKSGFSNIVVYMGFKGHYIACPLFFVKFLEEVLARLPHSLRNKARGTPLNNIFLSGKKK